MYDNVLSCHEQVCLSLYCHHRTINDLYVVVVVVVIHFPCMIEFYGDTRI